MPHHDLPQPHVVDARHTPLDDMLKMEWLLTNRLGSYCSSTVVGCNTRRYHGLLVAATKPPVGRQVVLSHLLEQIVIGDRVIDLSTNQFAGAVSPTGYHNLRSFTNDIAPTWVFEFEGITVTKQITLAEQANTIAVRYKVDSPQPVKLRVWPFVALRDFHSLRRVQEPHQMMFLAESQGVRVEDRQWGAESAWITCPGSEFVSRPQWWYRFLYSVDVSRGQDGFEDLYTPGCFQLTPRTGSWTEVITSTEHQAKFDFEGTVHARRRRAVELADSIPNVDDFTRRLAMATDAFQATRHVPSGASATIVAGYHWFGDWGRDSFISLPGLTLATGQHEKARQILHTFAEAIREGMVPNRFDDYGGSPHYNSIDASLWFIHAVDRYLRASNDQASWGREFMLAAHAILRAYHDGTQFQIHADADGLVTGGTSDTQLTWMDVKFNNQAITPRQGKPVEVNALWLEALHIMAERCRGVDDKLADHYAAEAQRVAQSFVAAFWFESGGYLHDTVGPEGPDSSLRPNQIIAVAMPHCPLSLAQQQSVVRIVVDNLLTPFGLRTLAPSDPHYRGTYGGSWESRDRAYHQGTIWPWLMGPMVQAYLKVHDFSPPARRQAGNWLEPFERHLAEAGLGSINEIFSGDPPFTPGGCIAQAWSVAEVLRAKLMVQRGQVV